ncbi:hypothetical protein MRX96_015962 [Rhipicephalus microplus]
MLRGETPLSHRRPLSPGFPSQPPPRTQHTPSSGSNHPVYNPPHFQNRLPRIPPPLLRIDFSAAAALSSFADRQFPSRELAPLSRVFFLAASGASSSFALLCLLVVLRASVSVTGL